MKRMLLGLFVLALMFLSQVYVVGALVTEPTQSPTPINNKASSAPFAGVRNQNISLQTTIIHPLYSGISPPLSTITPQTTTQVLESREVPLFLKPNITSGSGYGAPSTYSVSSAGGQSSRSGRQANVQPAVAPSQVITTIVTFDGLKNPQNPPFYGFSVVPPDTEGDVGPNHYIQSVNLVFGVWNKAGTLLAGPLPEYALFASAGSPCGTATGAGGDPIVLYDHLADRWLFTYLSYPSIPGTNYYLCTAVSQSGDPLGAWYLYVWTWPGGLFPDYPKYGVWPDGYYLSVNQFSNDLSSWAGAAVAVMDRSKMIAGVAPSMAVISFPSSDFCDFSFLPSDLDGPAPTPGTPNYFAELMFPASYCGFDGLDVWKFSANFSTSTFAFTHEVSLVTAPFDWDLFDCPGGWCIPQKGTSNKLDSLADRLMHRLQYRNFGGYQTLVTLHSVDVNGNNHAGIRWYELRNTGGGWFIYQQGDYAPDVAHRWMGSIAMDGSGDIGLCYSVSNPNNATGFFPSIRCTARLNGDPLGQMTQAEITIMTGGGSQLAQAGCIRSCHRWGDYSMLAVDPSDDHTFWYTNEYYRTSTGPFTPGWSTRIGSFTLRSLVTYGLALKAGWNLVSLPLVPLNPVITVVLSPLIMSGNLVIVWAYTGTPPTWKFRTPGGGSLTTMVDGPGYWVFVKFAATLQVTGYIVPPGGTPPSYSLVAGWNLIGFKPQPTIQTETVGQYLASLSTACSGGPCYDVNNIWIYDNANDAWIHATVATLIQPGWAMWIRMIAPATLYPQ